MWLHSVRLEKNCNDIFAILSDIVFRIYHVNCKALNNSKFYWNRILRYKTKRRLRKRSIITKLVICLSRESWFCEVFYLVSETQCSNSKNTFLQTRRFMDRFTYPRYPSGRSSSSRCQRRNSRDPNRTQKLRVANTFPNWKDHKEDFPENPSIRLWNPAKQDLGRASRSS